jgi:RNA polymerase sigma-70 factor (ECF subfamily)
MDAAQTFDRFYRETQQRVLTFLYATTGNLATAQDLTQEAYARAWQHWHKLADYDQPEAWVRTVGWRLASTRWRSARRWIAIRQRLRPPDNVAGPSPDNMALLNALQQIPAAQRQAVVLHHMYGMSVTEVASAAGVPVGTIKARLSRGRATLAALLHDSWEDHANV